jgi:hypothetical protein
MWKLTFINRRLQPDTREPRAGGLVNGYYEFLTNRNLPLQPLSSHLAVSKGERLGFRSIENVEQLQKWQGTERIEYKIFGFFVIDLIFVPFSSHFPLLSYLAEG